MMDDILNLKKQILEDITKLTITDEANIEPAHKVELLMTAIEAGHIELKDGVTKAYETAQNIENQDDRIDSLNKILDTINFYESKEQSNALDQNQEASASAA